MAPLVTTATWQDPGFLSRIFFLFCGRAVCSPVQVNKLGTVADSLDASRLTFAGGSYTDWMVNSQVKDVMRSVPRLHRLWLRRC